MDRSACTDRMKMERGTTTVIVVKRRMTTMVMAGGEGVRWNWIAAGDRALLRMRRVKVPATGDEVRTRRTVIGGELGRTNQVVTVGVRDGIATRATTEGGIRAAEGEPGGRVMMSVMALGRMVIGNTVSCAMVEKRSTSGDIQLTIYLGIIF